MPFCTRYRFCASGVLGRYPGNDVFAKYVRPVQDKLYQSDHCTFYLSQVQDTLLLIFPQESSDHVRDVQFVHLYLIRAEEDGKLNPLSQSVDEARVREADVLSCSKE